MSRSRQRTRKAATLLAAVTFLLVLSRTAGAERPRPNDVPDAATSLAPNALQIYNDYASPERTYSAARVVVHYVVVGIDAPPLNDDNGDGVPDYVEQVGVAADRALAYYERRGFVAPLPDTGGPDARPDLYVSRFVPGTFGVAFPPDAAAGGAFVAIGNNLDSSAGTSFASLDATVAHELFHLVQFAYFGPRRDPSLPPWILEGTAAAMEYRVIPGLDDIVSSIQLESWYAAAGRSLTTQSYGAQLLWQSLDSNQPELLPALFRRLASLPLCDDCTRTLISTFRRVSGRPFAPAFRRFAVSAVADHGGSIRPAFDVTSGDTRRGRVAPLAVDYIRVRLPEVGARAVTLTFRRPGEASATMTYQLDGTVAGEWPTLHKIGARHTNGWRTLRFVVTRRLLTNPRLKRLLLIVPNGAPYSEEFSVSVR